MVGSQVPAPRVAYFSSRGPSHMYPGVLKPDIAAPGVNILAAAAQSDVTAKSSGIMYKFDSGTSMAYPHVSGIVALLKSLHPDWSPAAIKSALVTTASVVDGYGLPILAESTPRKIADPFDYGGGQVNPERAVDPGLVYDIQPYDYLNFFYCSNGLGEEDDCSTAMSTDLYGLNLPSISIHDLKTSITVSRTVTNVVPVKSVYKASFEAPPGVNMMVNPDTLEFDESANTHTFKITFTAIHSIQGDFTFGSLTWSDNGAHTVRIPVAVRIIIEDLYADVS
ncbi:hypothetical protein LUZ60_016118 [Juncus effusus]|nr:hypothetical protein LUZ60_016118 [Juncus effusus]